MQPPQKQYSEVFFLAKFVNALDSCSSAQVDFQVTQDTFDDSTTRLTARNVVILSTLEARRTRIMRNPHKTYTNWVLESLGYGIGKQALYPLMYNPGFFVGQPVCAGSVCAARFELRPPLPGIFFLEIQGR